MGTKTEAGAKAPSEKPAAASDAKPNADMETETMPEAGAKASPENPVAASDAKLNAYTETRGFELPVNVIYRRERLEIGSELDLTREEFDALKSAGVFHVEWRDGE